MADFLNSKVLSSDDFLKHLQGQARHQAKLNQSRVLPAQLDGVLSLIGRYPWQTSLVASGVTALVIEVVRNF